MSRGQCWEKNEPKDNISGGYHVYMKISMSLVDECLQCVKEPTNDGDKNDVAVVVLILNVKKRWLATYNRNLRYCCCVSIPTQLSF